MISLMHAYRERAPHHRAKSHNATSLTIVGSDTPFVAHDVYCGLVISP